jgi:hypothetical protein
MIAAATAAAMLTACAATTEDATPESSTPDASSSDSGPNGSPSASTESQGDDGAASPGDAGTPITVTAGGQTMTATLNDSQVSEDLVEMLPVTLSWHRNYDIEYITELDAPLTETGPFYTDVQPGDLVYYNRMDSLTVIYEETSSLPTLTKMGQVTSDGSVLEDCLTTSTCASRSDSPTASGPRPPSSAADRAAPPREGHLVV